MNGAIPGAKSLPSARFFLFVVFYLKDSFTVGLKVRYQIPYEISGTIFESDIDTDFLNIPINSIGYQESNRFLSALWNQFNLELSPSHSPKRIPWAYFPGRYSDKKGNMASFIGFADTKIGKLIFVISYKVKGNISFLHIKKGLSKLSKEEEQQMIDITSRAISKKEEEIAFLCSCSIGIESNLLFGSYRSSRFAISSNQTGSFSLLFSIRSNNKIEATNVAHDISQDICAFLTVETNVLCELQSISIEEGTFPELSFENSPFVEDFLERYPYVSEGIISISSFAFRFINEEILGLSRLSVKSNNYKHFIASCNHFMIGRSYEIESQQSIGVIMPKTVLVVRKKDNIKRQDQLDTLAIMSYLSSVESATADDQQPEKCPECGAYKYKITSRVKDSAETFLKEGMGSTFGILYGIRSKFLHEGKFASVSSSGVTFPLLNEDNKSGLVETGGISNQGICVMNVREWTSRILRCIYQQKIMGRTSFGSVFYEPELELPIQIKVYPESGIKIVPSTKRNYDRIKILLYKIVRIIKYFFGNVRLLARKRRG